MSIPHCQKAFLFFAKMQIVKNFNKKNLTFEIVITKVIIY